MTDEIDVEGVLYISSKRAAHNFGYTQDYVGQLARGGQIVAKRVSGLWYVLEESVRTYKEKADSYKPEPPNRGAIRETMDTAVSFDGKDYVSAPRAAELTGYNPDYVGQLAREGKILSRQVGTRWYIDRAALMAHKKEKDALLAAVQAESVGLVRAQAPQEASQEGTKKSRADLHFKYLADEAPLIPKTEEEYSDESEQAVSSLSEPEYQIPIRVVDDPEDSEEDFNAPVIEKKYVTGHEAEKSEMPRMTIYLLAILSVIIFGRGGIWYAMNIGFGKNNPTEVRAANEPKKTASLIEKFSNADVFSFAKNALSSRADYKRE